MSETFLSSFSLENAYETNYQIQSSADRIDKFLSSNQKYQYDQQNNFQNSAQIILIFLDQNQNSDYLEFDSDWHDRYSHCQNWNLSQHDIIK